jgi:hypothetical protein
MCDLSKATTPLQQNRKSNINNNSTTKPLEQQQQQHQQKVKFDKFKRSDSIPKETS